MKYLLLTALIWGSLAAQEPAHSTITNLDKEPAPYVPDSTLHQSTEHQKSLAEMRRESAPGPTLGELIDHERMIESLGNSGVRVVPVVIPVFIGRMR